MKKMINLAIILAVIYYTRTTNGSIVTDLIIGDVKNQFTTLTNQFDLTYNGLQSTDYLSSDEKPDVLEVRATK